MPSFVNLPIAQISRPDTSLQGKTRALTAANLDFGPARPPLRGLYVHVPFCFHKCHYCDFYSIVDHQDRREAFVARLIEEIEASRDFLAVPLRTIFVGGGTPTLLPAPLWRRLLEVIGSRLPLADDLEFTVEANPETVDRELAEVLVAGGVNRVSIGAQSFDPRHLRMLERHHEPRNVQRCLDHVRRAGIANVNLDLIFGIPGQTHDEWRRDLTMALALAPDHLSCYGLMYEPNTPLTQRMRRGEVTPVAEDVEAAMFETTCAVLADAGFEQYEISNFCRPGFACRHNLLYWHNESWWPLGPAAAGHVGGVRWKNVPRLGEYLSSSTGGLPPIADVERVDDDGRAGEMLMLGLRLRAGIDLARLESLLAMGRRGVERRAAIDRHEASGLLERESGSLRFTRRGLLLADTVLSELV